MLVKELVQKLGAMPQEAEVVFYDSKGHCHPYVNLISTRYLGAKDKDNVVEVELDDGI